jgi:transposase
MKLHANARLSLKGRELLVDRVERAGWSLTQAAEAAGVSDRTARKWLERYRTEGPSGLLDRSSAPATVANRTDERRVQAIAALRRLRMTAAEIAEILDMALSTVSAILTRIGMGKLGRLGLEPAVRYERQRPGELVHIDVKKLGRIQGGAGKRVRDGLRQHYNPRRRDATGTLRQTVGWEFVHIAIDDATRLAYVEVLANEKATTAIAFLARAVKHFATYGVRVERVITDNGSAYRSTVHAIACRALGIRHLRTRPYPPDQRQSRTLHPHPPGRLGLRRHLRQQHPTHRRARRLDRLLQSPTTTRRPQPQAAHRSPPRAEQPHWVLHLARCPARSRPCVDAAQPMG